jgi:hypothetical protein
VPTSPHKDNNSSAPATTTTHAKTEKPAEHSHISKFLEAECGNQQQADAPNFLIKFDSIAKFSDAVKFIKSRYVNHAKFEKDYDSLLNRLVLVNTSIEKHGIKTLDLAQSILTMGYQVK